MTDIGQLYVSQMHDRVGFFATWPLNQEIKIGHYGPIKGKLFQPFSQLMGLVAQEAPGKATHDYTISVDRLLNAQAKALADAGVPPILSNISFRGEWKQSSRLTRRACMITRRLPTRMVGKREVEVRRLVFRLTSCWRVLRPWSETRCGKPI